MKYVPVFHSSSRFAVQIRSGRICHGILAPNAKHRAEIIPDQTAAVDKTTDPSGEALCLPFATRISWARLLKRVCDIDIEHCPHCGGEMKIIAAIEDPTVITKILAHLGLPTRPCATQSRFACVPGQALHGLGFRASYPGAHPPRSLAQAFDLFDPA